MFCLVLALIVSEVGPQPIAHAQETLVIQGREALYAFEVQAELGETQMRQLESDLTALSKIEISDSALSKAIFGTQTTYLDWFGKRIRQFVSYDPKPKMKHGKVVAKVGSAYADKDLDIDGKHFNKGVFMLAPAYFDVQLSSSRIAILIHEGRHADVTHHVKCLKRKNSALDPDMKRVDDACDENEFGSYTAEVFAKIHAARCLKDQTLLDAVNEAVISANRVQDVKSRRVIGEELKRLAPELKLKEMTEVLGLED